MNAFAVDTRALGIFRIGLALAILEDLATRALATELYTDDGPAPRALLASLSSRPILSLHMWSGSTAFQVALFAIIAAAAVALLVGFRTRAASVACFVLVVSLQERDPLVWFGGDMLLRALLFWAMLLPLGSRYSLDARALSSAPSAPQVLSPASAALFVQQIALYTGGVILKLHAQSWRDGSALAEVLRSDVVVSDLGVHFRDAGAVLTALTYATLVLEAVGPFFLLWKRTRLPAIGAFAALQIGMWLLLGHGQFQLVALVALLPLLPSSPSSLWKASVSSSSSSSSPAAPRSSAARIVGAAALAIMVAANVASCAGFDVARVPGLWWTGLAQNWGMYANPARLPSGWFLVVGTTEDGRDVDELHGGPASEARPEHPFSAYADFRTRRVFEATLHEEFKPLVDEVGRWQCRRHPEARRMRGWFADDRALDAAGKPTLFALFDVACGR